MQNGMGKQQEIDLQAMQLALREAQAAAEEGETPIGAVLMRGDTVIATAHNKRELRNDVTAHA